MSRKKVTVVGSGFVGSTTAQRIAEKQLAEAGCTVADLRTISARSDGQDGVLTIAVRDTGPGIPADKRSAIFEPFFTTKAEGSGLGLWIVQQIITAHGGMVEASDAAGGGALFAVHLPLRKKENGNG